MSSGRQADLSPENRLQAVDPAAFSISALSSTHSSRPRINPQMSASVRPCVASCWSQPSTSGQSAPSGAVDSPGTRPFELVPFGGPLQPGPLKAKHDRSQFGRNGNPVSARDPTNCLTPGGHPGPLFPRSLGPCTFVKHPNASAIPKSLKIQPKLLHPLLQNNSPQERTMEKDGSRRTHQTWALGHQFGPQTWPLRHQSGQKLGQNMRVLG